MNHERPGHADLRARPAALPDGARHPRRRLLFAGAAALSPAVLGACVVAPYGPYYRPSADHPAASFKGAWCQGAAGPPTVMELALAEGLRVSASTVREGTGAGARLGLRMTVTTVGAGPLRFEHGTAEAVDSRSGAVLATAGQMRVLRSVMVPATQWIDPTRLRPSGAIASAATPERPQGSASLRVALEPGFVPERIKVEGLALARDGAAPISMPELLLVRAPESGPSREYRSEALQAELHARAAACRRDTPQRNCDDIVRYGPSHSFLVETPGARFSGRWYSFLGRETPRIDGSVQIDMLAAGRWRLAADALTVRDAASGAARRAPVEHLQVLFADMVAIDTPLFAGPVDGREGAQCTIELPLPPAPPDFELRVPPLVAGARRIEVPRIRFNRRSFDGGIEPFNC